MEEETLDWEAWTETLPPRRGGTIRARLKPFAPLDTPEKRRAHAERMREATKEQRERDRRAAMASAARARERWVI